MLTGPSRRPETLAVHARQHVVLACGGLGNAQVLLQPTASSGVPVGNESGQVGRFLMEHPHVVGADVLVHRAAIPPLPDGFGPGLPAFGLAEAVMARHDLLQCSLAVQGPIEPPPGAADVQAHFETTFGVPLQWAALFARAEQEPAATNRAELLADTNWAGSHRLRTHCSFSSRDLRSIETSTRLLGEAFVSMRIGAARLHNRRIYRETFGGGHTMGTTRMGTAGCRLGVRCDAAGAWVRQPVPGRELRVPDRRGGQPDADGGGALVPAGRAPAGQDGVSVQAMTRRGFLWLVRLGGLPGVASRTGGRDPDRVPPRRALPSRFVDHDGWIVTAADRDALVGSRGARFAADARKSLVAGLR